MNVYEVRWRNAQRMGRKIQKLIDQGYIVRDERDQKVYAMEVTDCAVYQVLGPKGGRVIYFECDMEMDHGYHTPIKEWNAHFKDWTFYHPRHARKLMKGKTDAKCNESPTESTGPAADESNSASAGPQTRSDLVQNSAWC